MDIQTLIREIAQLVRSTFSAVDQWFEKDPVLRAYRPATGGWTIDQILEHIGLTNHFLLILIDKGTQKALLNVHRLDLSSELAQFQLNREKLDAIGRPGSFNWIRPEHMEPNGEKTTMDVRQQLKEQVARCLNVLEQLKNGEGVLYKTTMTVNDLGKINVYEYIYFLAQHAQRHLGQMEKIEVEFYRGKQ